MKTLLIMIAVLLSAAAIAGNAPDVAGTDAPVQATTEWAPSVALMPDECCPPGCRHSCTEDPPIVATAIRHDSLGVSDRHRP